MYSNIIMSKIVINNVEYKIHPVYDLYGASANGKIIHISKQLLTIGFVKEDGYVKCNIRQQGQKGKKTYQFHRFVWECFNGSIPDGKVINHVNEIKHDNRLCNLQLLTQQQIC